MGSAWDFQTDLNTSGRSPPGCVGWHAISRVDGGPSVAVTLRLSPVTLPFVPHTKEEESWLAPLVDREALQNWQGYLRV
jgi:hypothetical protein